MFSLSTNLYDICQVMQLLRIRSHEEGPHPGVRRQSMLISSKHPDLLSLDGWKANYHRQRRVRNNDVDASRFISILINSFIHPISHLSIHLTMHPFIHVSIHLFIFISLHNNINLTRWLVDVIVTFLSTPCISSFSLHTTHHSLDPIFLLHFFFFQMAVNGEKRWWCKIR